MFIPIVFDPGIPAALSLYTADAAGWPVHATGAAEDLAAHVASAMTLALRLTRHDPHSRYAWPSFR